MDRRLQEENEKKKEYLKSYQRAVKRERDILEEIKRLRADKMFPSVVNDGMPKGSSQSDLSDYIAILDEQIELLKKERLKKVQQYRKIENQIRKMHSEDERKVLRFFPHLVEIDVLKLYNTFKIYLPRGIFIWTNLLSYLTQPMN